MTVKWYFLRWLRGFANIAQGLAQVLSFGCWEPNWSLHAEKLFLDASTPKQPFYPE
jgi:hypothetical protein